MPNSPNYLRSYRKRSPLTQSDVAYLMGLQDYGTISRCEKGQRRPSVELLLVYHHLFNAPIESFFEHQSEEMLLDLKKRMESLIYDLKKRDGIPKNAFRLRFLEQTLSRLTK